MRGARERAGLPSVALCDVQACCRPRLQRVSSHGRRFTRAPCPACPPAVSRAVEPGCRAASRHMPAGAASRIRRRRGSGSGRPHRRPPTATCGLWGPEIGDGPLEGSRSDSTGRTWRLTLRPAASGPANPDDPSRAKALGGSTFCTENRGGSGGRKNQRKRYQLCMKASRFRLGFSAPEHSAVCLLQYHAIGPRDRLDDAPGPVRVPSPAQVVGALGKDGPAPLPGPWRSASASRRHSGGPGGPDPGPGFRIRGRPPSSSCGSPSCLSAMTSRSLWRNRSKGV